MPELRADGARGSKRIGAQGTWADVESAGLGFAVATKDNADQRTDDKLVWMAGVRVTSGDQIDSVTVYDVTFDESELTLQQKSPDLTNGLLMLKLRETGISQAVPQWLERDELTERIFKIVLINEQQETMVLYQPVLVQTHQLRDYIQVARQR